MAGTKIEGYWAWWPFAGPARRFETEDEACLWVPVNERKVKKGEDLPQFYPPHGPKYVMQVSLSGAQAGDDLKAGSIPFSLKDPLGFSRGPLKVYSEGEIEPLFKVALRSFLKAREERTSKKKAKKE